MEKPVIQVDKIKPMAEPPTPQAKHSDSDAEIKQWIHEAKYAAMQQLETYVAAKIAHISEYNYNARNIVDINLKITITYLSIK